MIGSFAQLIGHAWATDASWKLELPEWMAVGTVAASEIAPMLGNKAVQLLAFHVTSGALILCATLTHSPCGIQT